jgi:hypothetical protein
MLFVLNDFDLLNFYDFSLSLEDHFEYSFVMWITKQVTFLKKIILSRRFSHVFALESWKIVYISHFLDLCFQLVGIC